MCRCWSRPAAGSGLTGAARVLLRHAHEIFAQLERVQSALAAYATGAVGEVRIPGFTTAHTGLVLPAVSRASMLSPRSPRPSPKT
ncbi:MAG: hypothetical protein ACRDRG_14150 [Pseudonocardiaceae bacterium]